MKIVLAVPQPNLRYGLQVLLSEQTGRQIVGVASSPDELIPAIARFTPDLLLVSLQMVRSVEVGLLRTLKQRFPGLRVICMDSRAENRDLARQAGADGFICQAEPPEKLLAVIELVAVGVLDHEN